MYGSGGSCPASGAELVVEDGSPPFPAATPPPLEFPALWPSRRRDVRGAGDEVDPPSPPLQAQTSGTPRSSQGELWAYYSGNRDSVKSQLGTVSGPRSEDLMVALPYAIIRLPFLAPLCERRLEIR